MTRSNEIIHEIVALGKELHAIRDLTLPTETGCNCGMYATESDQSLYRTLHWMDPSFPKGRFHEYAMTQNFESLSPEDRHSYIMTRYE